MCSAPIAKKDEPQIVLNRMYNGSYLEDNLGHEIINTYQADDGNYYLYLNDRGNFNLARKGCVKKMLLVRNSPYAACVEVIGLADDLEDVYGSETHNQEDYIDTVTYGGVSLRKLFEGYKEQNNGVYITYQAKRVVRPKKRIYIVFGEREVDLGKATIIHLEAKQGKNTLKQYFSGKEHTSDYNKLQALFNEKDMSDAMPMSKIDINALNTKASENFFEVCGIENNELAFSNIFAHFFKKYPEILSEMLMPFCHEEFKSSDLSIRRESYNIDILVKTSSHIIVIENKVLSSINGVDEKKKLTPGCENIESQLGKYYDITQGKGKGKGEEEFKDDTRERQYVLLTPDHNRIKNLLGYRDGNEYHEILYSEVRKILMALPHSSNDRYLQELIAAMEPHTKPYYNPLFEATEKRFYERLKSKIQ